MTSAPPSHPKQWSSSGLPPAVTQWVLQLGCRLRAVAASTGQRAGTRVLARARRVRRSGSGPSRQLGHPGAGGQPCVEQRGCCPTEDVARDAWQTAPCEAFAQVPFGIRRLAGWGGHDLRQGASVAAAVGGAVAKCVTGTHWDWPDVAVRVDLLAWDGVRRGRRPAPSETCVGMLITRRSQVQILPPLPTRQRHNRSSAARKLSLRAAFVSGGGVRSDQIADH